MTDCKNEHMKYAIKTLKILSKPFSLNHLIKIEYCVARDSALKYSKIFDLALWPKSTGSKINSAARKSHIFNKTTVLLTDHVLLFEISM